jgi:pentatricopeptide repeat protein
MVADGAIPNTKTFTALIGSFGKMGSVAAALDIIWELLSHEPGGVGSPATYAALMAACEKAGQGELALALFEKMCTQVSTVSRRSRRDVPFGSCRGVGESAC